MIKRLFFISIAIFLNILSSLASPAPAYNILVLHSYHSSFKWNIEIKEGLDSFFASQADQFHLLHEYMDTKRTIDLLSQQILFELYKHKYSDVDIDVIIVSDDDALNFMMEYGERLFPKKPVVFCGINNYDEKIRIEFPHYTGVIENLDVKKTVEQAIKLFPETKHIYFVGDHSTTAYDLSNKFRRNHQDSFADKVFHYLHESKLENLLSVLENLPENAIIMLWPYLNQNGNLIIPVEQSTREITKASAAPVFGFWHFMMGYGIIGGKLASGNAQGESAAQKALRIIAGEPAEDIPVTMTVQNEYYFDYPVLEKFKVSLSSLPKNKVILNKSPGFIKENQNIIIGFFISLALFSLLFVITILINRRIKRVLRYELAFRNELINALPNPIFFMLDNKKVEDCNKAFEKLTGHSKEEIIGNELPGFYPPNQVDLHRNLNEEVISNHRSITYEGQIIVQGSKVRDVIFYKSIVYNKRTKKYGIIETIVDITDKKIAIERIRLSEERYALAIQATKDGIWDWNIKEGDFFASSRIKQMLGYSEKESPITHHNFLEFIHPADVSVFNYQLELLQQEIKDTFAIEMRMRQKSGNFLWVESKVFALSNPNKGVYRLVGSVSDIQTRKDNEFSLKKWEDIFSNTLMGVATANPITAKPELMNPVFAHLHGYTREEMAGKTFDEFMAPATKEEMANIFLQAAQKGHYVFETIHQRKDGSVFPVMIDITGVKNNQDDLLYFIINLQDISQRKRQENKIAQMLQNEQTMNEELRSSEEEVRQTLQQTVNLKEKLEENQKQFLSFIDGTSDFAILKDKQLRYVLANQAFAGFFKLHPGQIAEKSDEEIAPDWLAKSEKEYDLQVLQNNKPVIYEREVNGQFFETRKFPVYFENNNIGVGAFIRDITRQRIIEQQVLQNEQRFRTLLENSFDMITLTNTEGIILYCTDAIQKIFGYANNDVVGKHFSQFFHPEDRADFGRKFENILSSDKDPAYIQHRVKHLSQGYKNIQTIATNHLQNPLINAIVFTSRDVSMELQSRELKKNIALAQKSAEIKQQFLANMSHEIRTPMNGIVGMIEFLLNTPLNPTQEDYIKTIKYSADSLLNIINDVLDFSKIEAGKLSINPTPVHIKKFITDAPKIFAAMVKQKSLDFNVFIDESLPEYLNIDPLRLNQVLSNLLSNAIKFTPSGSITLRVFPDKTTNDIVSLKVEVQDTGIGISANEQKTLFKPFIQIDSTLTRSIEGTGLGLTISQRIVELMDGEIGVVSEKGKGSMFWFTITTTIPEGEKVKSFTASTQTVQNKNLNINVLLVEDKIVNQKVIKLMLESMGCKTTIASNGKEAIELLKNNQSQNAAKPAFEIILMDIQMPVMDGITATRIIRQQFTDYPVIIGLSANVFSADVEGFLKSGLDDYIIKPANSDELYKKLLYWSKKAIPINTVESKETLQFINQLGKEIVLDNQSFNSVVAQSEHNSMVLNELFSAFFDHATDLSKTFRNSLMATQSIAEEDINALYQLALSMGAIQLAKTCEVLNENINNDSVSLISIVDYLDLAIKNYATEVINHISK